MLPKQLGRFDFMLGRWRVFVTWDPRYFTRLFKFGYWWLYGRAYGPLFRPWPSFVYNVMTDLHERRVMLGPIQMLDTLTPPRFERP